MDNSLRCCKFEKSPSHAAAIVGMACRFPSATNLEAYWDLLAGGRCAVAPIPAERWTFNHASGSHSCMEGKPICPTAGLLDDVAGFDWRYFGIPPKEARFLDPQHRLLLEVTHEAIEDAGLPFGDLAGQPVGVFVGISSTDYAKLATRNACQIEGYVTSGTSAAFAANRVSHWFDFRGPSLVLDAACASSLAALHYACESLARTESALAIVGGVNMLLLAESSVAMSAAGLLSPTGRCAFLDASANGFVRGEGAGVLVLKPLSQVAPTDRVYAIVRGTAVGHNGRTNWIMEPSAQAQQRMIETGLERARLASSAVDYAEMHGTAFARGDVVEAQALGTVLREGRSPDNPCKIGSVKPSIGNLEAAAGVASVIKVALCLWHRRLVPTLNLNHPNPDIDFSGLLLDPQRCTEAWPDSDDTPAATVTALSFGGSNAFAVLEGCDSLDQDSVSDEEHVEREVLLLSAKTRTALRTLAEQFTSLLQEDLRYTIFRRICYASRERRTVRSKRLAIAARDRQQMVDELASFLAERQGPNLWFDCAPNAERELDKLPAALTCEQSCPRSPASRNLDEACEAWVQGQDVDFAFLRPRGAKHIDLPSYPFERERIWLRDAHDKGKIKKFATLISTDTIREMVAEILGLPRGTPIADDERIFELGINSVSAVQLRQQLAEASGLDLPATIAFDFPEIAKLAQHIRALQDPSKDKNKSAEPRTTGVTETEQRSRDSKNQDRGSPSGLSALTDEETEEELLRRLEEIERQ